MSSRTQLLVSESEVGAAVIDAAPVLTVGGSGGSVTESIQQNEAVRFVLGRGLAALGDQFLLFAIPLLVYKTTGSASATGLVFLVEWLPRVLFLPVAGVLADRLGGYRLYLGADCLRALLGVTGFILVKLWPDGMLITLSVLAAAMSLASAQAYVAMETTLPRFVPPMHMVRAQSMIQGTEEASLILGPALAALLAALLATDLLLLATGVLFAVTAINVFLLRGRLRTEIVNAAPTSLRSVFAGVAEGISTLRTLPAMLGLVGLTMTVNLMVGMGMATSASITSGTFGKPDSYFGGLSVGAGILSLITFFAIPLISRRISSLVAILAVYVIICLGGVIVGQAGGFVLFAIGYVLLVGAVGALNVFIRAERIRRIPREHLGKTIGLIILLNQVSLPLSGFLVAVFANTYGPQNVVLAAVVGSALIALALLPLVLKLRYYDENPGPTPHHE
jgi:MFS family permease